MLGSLKYIQTFVNIFIAFQYMKLPELAFFGMLICMK